MKIRDSVSRLIEQGCLEEAEDLLRQRLSADAENVALHGTLEGDTLHLSGYFDNENSAVRYLELLQWLAAQQAIGDEECVRLIRSK